MCQISDLFVSFVLNQGRKLSCSSSELVMVLSWCFKCPNECQTSCVFKLARYLPRKKMLKNAIFCKEMVFSCFCCQNWFLGVELKSIFLFYSTHLSKTDTSMPNPTLLWDEIPTPPQKMANLTTPNLPTTKKKHQPRRKQQHRTWGVDESGAPVARLEVPSTENPWEICPLVFWATLKGSEI